MRKKSVILIFFAIIFVFFLITFTYFQYKRSFENKVLDLLEKNFEFCKIQKEKISPQKGEFWLICNQRPFYAFLENGKINFELNGWGFLKKQPEILSELQDNNCRFYNFSENKLTFICEDKKVRIYNFSPSDFQLTKLEEDLFINYISKKLMYDLDIIGDFAFEIDREKFLGISAKYQGYDTKLALNIDKMYLTLPIVVDERLNKEEKAKLSFELINVCQVEYIQEISPIEVILGMNCNLGKPDIVYNFESGLANFLIEEKEFETLFPYLGKYHLNDTAGIGLKYLGKEEKNGRIFKYYLARDRVVIAESVKNSGLISQIYFKNESLK